MRNRLSFLCAALALALAATGCGGGGGGGSTAATPATIDGENAVAVVYDTESSMNKTFGVSDLGRATESQARVPVAFGGAAPALVPAAFAAPTALVAEALGLPGHARESSLPRTISGLVVPDQCGDGTMTLSGSASLTASAANVNVTAIFEDFDSCDGVYNGKLAIKIAETPASGASTYTATGLSVVTPGKDATLDGKIVYAATNQNWEPQSGSFTINLSLTSGGDTVRISGLVVTFDRTTQDYANLVTMDGSLLFDSKKVTIATTTPIGFAGDRDDHPSAGQYVLDAKGKLRVTYLDADNLRIEADGDENGTWDVVFEGTWESFYNLAQYPDTGASFLTLTAENVHRTAFQTFASYGVSANLPFAQPDFSASRAPALARAPGLPGPALAALGAGLLTAREGAVTPLAAAVITDRTQNGLCGGSMLINGTLTGGVDGNTLDVTVVFDNYNSCAGYALTGNMSFTALGSQNSIDATFTLDNLNAASTFFADHTVTMNGTVAYAGDYALNQYTLTADMTWSDLDDTVELENFVVFTDETNYPTVAMTVNGAMEINGKRLDVTTLEDIVTDDVDSHPSSGVVLLDGKGQLKVTFVSATQILLQLDGNEDGDYDDSGDFEFSPATWPQFYGYAGLSTM